MNNVDFTFCELREREIINVEDGKKLGRLSDIAFDSKGRVLGLIVPGEKKFIKNFTGVDNIFIPWNCILKIGNDVILVDLNNNVNPNPKPPHRDCIPSPC